MPPEPHRPTTDPNLRAAFDVWPPGEPLPVDVDGVAQGALGLTVAELLRGRGSAIEVVRFADDGVSLWRLDVLPELTVEDLVRAIATAFEPPAYAMAVVQPARAPGDPTVRGVHCRAMHGDVLIDVTGDAVGSGADRAIPSWTVRRGKAANDRGRWIGVPPTVEVHLPLLGAGDA